MWWCGAWIFLCLLKIMCNFMRNKSFFARPNLAVSGSHRTIVWWVIGKFGRDWISQKQSMQNQRQNLFLVQSEKFILNSKPILQDKCTPAIYEKNSHSALRKLIARLKTGIYKIFIVYSFLTQSYPTLQSISIKEFKGTGPDYSTKGWNQNTTDRITIYYSFYMLWRNIPKL